MVCCTLGPPLGAGAPADHPIPASACLLLPVLASLLQAFARLARCALAAFNFFAAAAFLAACFLAFSAWCFFFCDFSAFLAAAFLLWYFSCLFLAAATFFFIFWISAFLAAFLDFSFFWARAAAVARLARASFCTSRAFLYLARALAARSLYTFLFLGNTSCTPS